jgi:hypothetical protein
MGYFHRFLCLLASSQDDKGKGHQKTPAQLGVGKALLTIFITTSRQGRGRTPLRPTVIVDGKALGISQHDQEEIQDLFTSLGHVPEAFALQTLVFQK